MNPCTATTLRLEKPSRDTLDEVLATIERTVTEFGRQHQWNEQTGFRVNLVLEELTTNTVNHGTPPDTEPADVTIRLNHGEDEVRLTYSDEGVAFNPITESRRPRHLVDHEAELEIGGLGIELIKRMTNTMEYRRHEHQNELSMTVLKEAPSIAPA